MRIGARVLTQVSLDAFPKTLKVSSDQTNAQPRMAGPYSITCMLTCEIAECAVEK